MRDIANLKEISERFNNGTETIEDIINYCRNYEITFGYNATMKVVEKKYFDKLVKKIQELEEENKEIKNTKMNGYLHENIWLAKYLSELYLPKQKVKDKIKELEKAKNKTNKEHWKYNYTLQIAILKELLEESK